MNCSRQAVEAGGGVGVGVGGRGSREGRRPLAIHPHTAHSYLTWPSFPCFIISADEEKTGGT